MKRAVFACEKLRLFKKWPWLSSHIVFNCRYAENPEEDFKSQKASKLQREFERQFAVSVSSFSDEEEAQAARAWAVQADPFIQKLVSAQQLVAR